MRAHTRRRARRRVSAYFSTSRNAARRRFTAADLAAQTAGVECRKDVGVVDEIPAAYKDLDAVIAAQSDLVEVVARLTTLLCVKG